MPEKPILFSTDMVRAILDGRKTQTRRIVKPGTLEMFVNLIWNPNENICFCPYRPGDILYIRETWAKDRYGKYHYRAEYPEHDCEPYPIWKPSIHMPREAARLFLEVTEVRVERLQKISEEDARAEGIGMPLFRSDEIEDYGYIECFEMLWDSIYSKRGHGWEQNPWVWAITFKRAEVSAIAT